MRLHYASLFNFLLLILYLNQQIISCKNVFSGFQKVPRSPVPSGGKNAKSDGEIGRMPYGAARDEGAVPVRLLADSDSLFITCQGLFVHYKLCFPASPHRSLWSNPFLDPSPSSSSLRGAPGKLKFDRRPPNIQIKAQNYLHRGYGSQSHSSSLYDPLLDGSETYPAVSEEIPHLNLGNLVEENQMNNLNSGNTEQFMEASCKFGVVLVHGFGGGVFSWRNVMGVLAEQVGCTVAAFDRPGWGLTSRPGRKDWEGKELCNPYKLDSQVISIP